MFDDYIKLYELITQNCNISEDGYAGPEKQGAAIQKCSILEVTNIEYSNETR